MTPQDVIVRPRPWRRRVLLGAWLTAAAIICARAVQVQGVQAQQWRAVAEAQHRRDEEVVAARGSVLYRDGTPLAVSRERFSVGIAPNELINVEAARALLVDALSISPQRAKQLTGLERRWSVVPGRYPPAVRRQLNGVRGIHVTRELQRYHPLGDLSDGVLGVVRDNIGRGGVEQAFQDLLSGRPGQVVVARATSAVRSPASVFSSSHHIRAVRSCSRSTWICRRSRARRCKKRSRIRKLVAETC